MESLHERTIFEGGFAAAMFSSPPSEEKGVFENPNPPGETSIPAFSSKPNAPATLYLDFKGHSGSFRGNNQPGEPDGNFETPKSELFRGASPEDFSKSDSIAVRVIREVWQAIAEKFASFNVNVTTVDPGDFSDGKALRVAVGGMYQDCCRSMLQYR